MNRKQNSVRPSRGDMELLSVLWEHGPASLSEVHEQMPEGVAYTTVQTRLNRLVGKGLADREKAGRQPLKYRASVEPDDISAPQLDTLVERVAGGSVIPLVAQLVKKTDFSASELSELKQLVHEAEKRSSDGARSKKGGAR